MFDIDVYEGDVLTVQCDVLLLKYAQRRWGGEPGVANELVARGVCTLDQISPLPGEHVLVDTNGQIGPTSVLFLGTPTIDDFGYIQMFEFARDALRFLILNSAPVGHLATTIHGVNYGLDAGESFNRLVAGFQRAHRAYADRTGPSVERITFVEKEPRRAKMLLSLIDAGAIEKAASPPEVDSSRESASVAPQGHLSGAALVAPPAEPPDEKQHIFVAMPFSPDFEDVYEFGIYGPVRDSGYICEHVGEAAFTGDVLERIRERISSAKLVVADLTEARPNVYLEVGFAWGRNTPVVFLARAGEKLHFDVSTHRCIYYRNITHLAKELRELLDGLTSGRRTLQRPRSAAGWTRSSKSTDG